jgi:branched-chain amino acid transport system permease protein
MTFDVFVQSVLNGLTIGVINALLALGLTLLYGIMDILFFAHGAMFMFGAATAYFLCVKFGMPYLLAALVAIGLVGGLNFVAEKSLFKPIRGQVLPVFFVAISLNWFMESAGYVLFGLKPKRIPSVITGDFKVFGASLTWERFAFVLIGIGAVFGLHLFLTRTRWGLGMRAYSENREAAELQGIGNDFINSLGFLIAGLLAALAGLLVASLYLVQPTMGDHAVLNGMLIIALGGLGSIPGAMIAALMLGFIEAFGAVFIGADYTWGPMFVIVMVLLIIKPTGLMGVQR